MRFASIAVPAYGPFTDLTLDLGGGGDDLHIVYGPNEAGKSSLLRAIGDLLYGIPERAPDSFRHAYGELRIAAEVAGNDGRRIAFQRRKGRRNTLRDAAGTPVADDALAGFLGPVDREFFARVFGLGAAELREGAEALLEGHGDLGEALFSATLAGTPVHQVAAALEAECDALYRARARKGISIRTARDAYDESRSRSREAMVRPDDWEAAVRALEEARTVRAELEEELGARRARQSWVERCLAALPLLGQLEEQEQLLAALPVAPDPASPALAAAEQALGARDEAQRELARLRADTARLEARVREDDPDPAALSRAADIDFLHGQLAVHRQGRRELDGQQADLARARAELDSAMSELGLGDAAPAAAEALRLPRDQALALEAAAERLDAAAAAAQAHRQERDRVRELLAKVDGKLAQRPRGDVSALRAGLARTGPAAEAERQLPAREQARDEARMRLASQHQLLREAPAEIERAVALGVPSRARLDALAREWEGLEQERALAERQLAEREARLRELGAERERLGQGRALPSLDALYAARARRERAWDRVRVAWSRGDADEEIDGLSLAEVYLAAVAEADRMADRLREEAAAVARAAELELQARDAEAAREAAAGAVAKAGDALVQWDARWRGLWAECGVTPAAPREMQEWREHWLELRSRYEEWRGLADEVERMRGGVDEARALWAPLLPGMAGQPLAVLRVEAEQRVSRADALEGERRLLDDQRAELRAEEQAVEARREALETAEEAARSVWRERCQAVSLPLDAGTRVARELLAQRRELVRRLDAWIALGAAVDAKRQAVHEYEARVHAVADALGMPPGSAELREGSLWAALAGARERQARQQQTREDLDEARAHLPRLQQSLEEAQAIIARAVVAAGCADEDGLRGVLGDLRTRQAVEARIADLRRTLHEVAARGEPLDELITRVRAESPDGLEAERHALHEAVAELEGRKETAIQALTRAEAAKARLDEAGAEAALHLQEARSAAARLRQDAARYLRLRLAVHFLRGQIDRYRKQSQGPLLTRAGALFSAITAGSFTGLATAPGDDDKPLLVGLRQDEEVRIEAMSEGTRDQLYLALRLAAIERHQARHEPMPLILDDLLVTFDDRRAAAILPLLRDLGTRTQVLLFTHHRHLVGLARDTLGEGGFRLHELAASAPAGGA